MPYLGFVRQDGKLKERGWMEGGEGNNNNKNNNKMNIFSL
jgi:hypothetical protein